MTKVGIKHRVICFILTLTAGVLSAADRATTNSATVIPWNQIGAKAGADYKGDGLAVTPTESGARLHCLFQRLDAEATPEGLLLTSIAANGTPDRFRVTATGITRGSDFGLQRQSWAPTPLSGQLPASGIVSIDAQTVRFTRPGLTEEYTVSMDGLRQDFVVQQAPPSPSPPLGERAGERWHFIDNKSQVHGNLILTLSVTGATVEPAPDGATLILPNSGRHIAYNRLRVTDATGKELPAHFEVIPVADEVTSLKLPDLLSDDFEQPNANLAIVIDDSNALYPLRIDPTFSDANWHSMGGFPGASDYVYAAATDSSGNLYIGGQFNQVGNAIVNNIAKWNGTNWSGLGSGVSGIPLSTGPYVFALAVSGNTVYAGGQFTNAGGVVANSIAQWNGTNWSALGSGVSTGSRVSSPSVFALAVAGGKLYAGGVFTNAGGIVASNIAQWDGVTWAPLGLGVGGKVVALAVSGSTLYAAGTFITAGGNPASSVAAWNGTNWSGLGSGIASTVYSMAVLGNTLYVGGGFTLAGGMTIRSIAQWNGTNWSSVGSGMNNMVLSLAVSGNILYAGGAFTTAGGVAATNIAQWDGTNWSSLNAGFDNYVLALAVSGSTLYVAGQFSQVAGRDASYIAQWNGTNWSTPVSGVGMNGTVNAVAVSGSTVYAGGNFTKAGGSPANHVAQWNGTGWSSLGSGLNGVVNALAVSNSVLYVGGGFGLAGGGLATNVAQWDGTNWSSLGSGFNNQVNALAMSGGILYAGGVFTMAGINSANYVAQWDGTQWSSLSSGMDGNVYALSASNGALYAGGGFGLAGGTTASNIAQWNGTNWSQLGSGMNNKVLALAMSSTSLYAGGAFTSAGGVAANHIAQWNGTNWSPLGSGMNGNIDALALSGSALVAGGNFIIAGGNPANSIDQWNGTNWSPLGSGVNNTINALAVSGSTVYVGGIFSEAGTNAAAYIAEAILPVSVIILTTDSNFGFTNGLFGFNLSGPPGSNVVIQSSSDLQSWTPLQTNSLGSGTIYFSDPQPPATTHRFYRAELSP